MGWPEAAEAVFQVLDRSCIVPLAILGHQEDLLAPSIHGKRLAHHFLGVAILVIPGIVEERDPLILSGVNDTDRFLFALHGADGPAANADHGTPDTCAAASAGGGAGRRG